MLIVEDNLEVGRFAGLVLKDLGYRTVGDQCRTGAEPRRHRRPGSDAIFSDVVMPGMTGVAMAKLLRAPPGPARGTRLRHSEELADSGYEALSSSPSPTRRPGCWCCTRAMNGISRQPPVRPDALAWYRACRRCS